MTYTDNEYHANRTYLEKHYPRTPAEKAADTAFFFSVSLDWSDIEACAKVHPEHAQHARDTIERILGYKPVASITIPHEVFIRKLIAQYKAGAISNEEYNHELVMHITHIRNDDVKKTLWANRRGYTLKEFSRYTNQPAHLRSRVAGKITDFFGEHPGLFHSLQAELMLLKAMQADPLLDVPYLTPLDYRAFTIIAYRKVWLEESESDANRSPLLTRRT